MPPTVDPDFLPVNVGISCYWIPYVVGAIKAMRQQATWQFNDPVELTTIQDRVQELIDIFTTAINSSACDGLLPPIACPYDFENTTAGWNPQVLAPYGDLAVWQVAAGWLGVIVEDDGTTCQEFLDIELDLSATHIDLTSIRVKGFRNNAAGGAFNGVLTYTSGTPTLFGNLPSAVGFFDVTLFGDALDVEKIVIDLGTHLVPGGCPSFDPNLLSFVQINGVASTSPCP